MLLDKAGNVKIVMRNKNKAVELVVGIAAMFRLGCIIEFPTPTGSLPLKNYLQSVPKAK